MNYVKLGNTGLEVSSLALGCMTYGAPDRGAQSWTLDEEKSRPLIRQAIESGINFFDTANIYSDGNSEEILGRALRDFAQRDEVVIATKVYFNSRRASNVSGLSRKAIFNEIDNSLKRLGTDYIDLYQIHRWDYRTPIEETLEALHDLVKAGKVLHIGASSMYAWQFAKALHTSQRHGWTPFVSMQNQLNLISREEEREMIPLCRDAGIAVIPWSPLARGRLTRDWDQSSDRAERDDAAKAYYTQHTAESDRKVVEAVATIAAERNVPRAQVALAWVIQSAGITAPLIGASKPHHLTDAIAALSLQLTTEERQRLEGPYLPHAVVGFN
ncbi:putative oxidoreductase, aryl-alcohol dehydrogenase like protein [Pseudomonas sp. GM21]|jgi:aryl-alcohol dehydrogenase-like predicted oxidoreductase|uniref:aldo/keto reductase n=1 Tax=Pseudomonas sp. GM21 TaxID=1144325 RepID=UPI00027228ED|nr:aldo/keto reductase [Pseudomonas sp. GM21]EJM21058.1 putative oxidoreductase, aryl-alcohol dehydrogenase like protein [Pseudomonas sp. GM21]